MARSIEVVLLGDSRSLERAFSRAEKSGKQFGRTMEGASRGAVVAAVGFHGLGRAVGYASSSFLGAYGLASAVKAGFDEMFAGQKVAAQTRAALKSTGDVAGVTATHINTLAGSLQKLSGYDDEAIQAAENLMLTFTNVRDVAGKNNDIFDQATLATLNLSRTFDQDLSVSAVQVGKALQDPVRGITALRRIGVSFTEAQQKLITRLVNTGNVLGAQKVIMAELNRETGGAAKAYGQTLPGQLDILKGNLTNLAGALAQVLNPEVKKLTDRFNKWLENPEHKKSIIEGFTTGVNDLGAAFNFAATAIGKAADAYKGFRDSIPKGALNNLFTGTALDVFKEFKKRIDIVKDYLGFGRGGGGGGGGAPKVPPGLQGPVGVRPPPGMLGPTTGGGAAPPTNGQVTGDSAADRQRRARLIQLRNTIFDAAINRQLGRVQDVSSISGQIARLQQISGEITKRIAVTKDITRKLNLEDQQLEVMRQIKNDRLQLQQDAVDAISLNVDRAGLTKTLTDDISALQGVNALLEQQNRLYGVTHGREQQIIANQAQIQSDRQQQADDAKQARLTALQNTLDWAQYKVDRTALTDNLKDDLKALLVQQGVIKGQIKTQGRTLTLMNDLLQVQLAIKQKRKDIAGETDPLANLVQVSSRQLANILAAGTGLNVAGLRRLTSNISGAEIQPVHVHVHLDGREVATAVTKQNARTNRRTPHQTSGARG